MMTLPRSRVRRLAVALPLAAALGACTTWSRRPVPAPAADEFYGGPVRVTRMEGSPVLLDNVTVGRDSVVGREHAAPHSRVAIPARDVRLVEARRVNPLRTGAVILVSLAAVVAVWGAFAIHTIAAGD
jgi:hypothetical protein